MSELVGWLAGWLVGWFSEPCQPEGYIRASQHKIG